MSVCRYLMNLAYIGTSFRGSQRQVRRDILQNDDPCTVQGRVEMGLKYINSGTETPVHMASRTDADVHALNTTCHFDIYRPTKIILEPSNIIYELNLYFRKKKAPIRILNCKVVPPNFRVNANIASRTYLYRIAVGKYGDCAIQSPLLHFIPIEELRRRYFIGADKFDLDTMGKAAKMLEGYHDFRTFMGKVVNGDKKITRKEILNINIVERNKCEIGVSSAFSWPSSAINNSDPDSHLILDIYFKGKGFLYKQ
ncbi:tRNA pseudouridine synthase A [Anthonomus grandis grandis]|uniref:tRNA pseudouridine synthase A n=1 Tax=Anthonomus grandis grandis TaxID=2921223 RepID=UPI0021666237|nr:tRNA pseudouridine synthase A [Anthonomus grandis grandis]